MAASRLEGRAFELSRNTVSIPIGSPKQAIQHGGLFLNLDPVVRQPSHTTPRHRHHRACAVCTARGATSNNPPQFTWVSDRLHTWPIAPSPPRAIPAPSSIWLLLSILATPWLVLAAP